MELPPIALMLNNEGAPVVRVEDQELADLPTLFGSVPALTDPAHARAAAEAVNHLSEGFEFEVIVDPESFRTSFMERLAKEDATEWQQGQPRLRDFGMPDLDTLAVPVTTDGALTFFAEDSYLGVIYKVTVSFDGAGADYTPLPTSPF